MWALGAPSCALFAKGGRLLSHTLMQSASKYRPQTVKSTFIGIRLSSKVDISSTT